jgi:hypothetical protein
LTVVWTVVLTVVWTVVLMDLKWDQLNNNCEIVMQK